MLSKQNIIVGIILFLSLLLKFHNYVVYPQRGATSDEYTYSFLGVSLLTKYIPISWSYFGAYKNRQDLTINKIYFPIVWPYFDHPPLNGLVVGGWALLFGENTFEKIQLSVIRIVPIFLSTVSSLLVYLIAQKRYGFRAALWALLIYTTVPIFVIQTRVVLAENLLTPLLLLTIYLYDRVQKRMSMTHAILLGVLSGLSLWTKEVGICVFIIVCFFMITDRIRIHLSSSFIFIFALFLLGYVAYGMYFDKEVFWNIITTQVTRDVGPQTLLYVLSTPIIINKIYYDGWYFLGFVSLFASLLYIKEFKIIIVPAFIYFLFLLLLLTQKAEMGWYLIPLFPFMAIVTSRFLVESLQTGNWYVIIMILFVGFSHMQHLYQENFGLTTSHFRFFSTMLFGPFILAIILKKENIFQKLGSLYFYSFIIGNIYLTYNYIHPA